MKSESYLAIDLGAESGRVMLGRLEAGRLQMEEIHRFSNGPEKVLDHLHWNILSLWHEIQNGLRSGWKICEGDLVSLGIDAWGVDFGLLDVHGSLIGNPYHYRDHRTDGMLQAGDQFATRSEIYRMTGIQFMEINSLYQLLSMRLAGDPALSIAKTFLNIPDIFNFWLTGRKASEFTIATTTQCFDTKNKQWSSELLSRFEIPVEIFQEVLTPGEKFCDMRKSLAKDLGIRNIPVAAIGSHDTASAVAAVPAEVEHFAFISSGTWSLVGSEIPEPVINKKSLEYNFTNEGGVCSTNLFLKNISGLWLIQECRRAWAAQGRDYSYDEITVLASGAKPFQTLVDPNDPYFLDSGAMPERIQQYAKQTDQPSPATVGEFARCAFESLALAYRQVIEQLEILLGFPIQAVHIVGGGSRNRLLNQFTADATGLPVIAGPVEATAMGNILVQAIAMRRIESLHTLRQIVRASCSPEMFNPNSKNIWDDAYGKWLRFFENEISTRGFSAH